MLENHEKAKRYIKIVFKYFLILAVLPYLCALMIPLFLLLLLPLLTDLYKTTQSAYTLFALSQTFDAIAIAVPSFIMALLISALAKNKEILMAMLGALIVAIIFLVYTIPIYVIMDIEGSWKYALLHIGVNGTSLFISALIGAWLVVKKRRAKTQTDNDQQNDPQDQSQPNSIPDNNIQL
jgi:Na+-driven multidrug efflux pump